MVEININYSRYMDTLQAKIGKPVQKMDGVEKNFADGIYDDKLWFEVVLRALDQISIEIADEIQEQSKMDIDKGTHRLNQRQATYGRLLALEVFLASWLGWVLNEKSFINGTADKTAPFSAPDSFKMIKAAFDYGEALSDRHHPKGIDQIIAKEESKNNVSK